MPSNTEYYEKMGVSQDASTKEIQKAFRKFAVKNHPDKLDKKAEDYEEKVEKFKEMSGIYEVLTDDEKRKMYDMGGEEAVQGGMSGGMPGGMNPEDLMDLLTGGRRRRQRQAPDASPDMTVPLKVPLEDLYNGKDKSINFTRKVKCLNCDAKGAVKPEDIISCPRCKGTGQYVSLHRTPMGEMMQQMPCRQCQAKGKSIKTGKECKECMGQKMVNQKLELDIRIEPGMMENQGILVEGKANQHPDCPTSGNLIFVIEELPSKTGLQREGNNLIYTKEVDLVDALCGVEFLIKHLDGRYLNASYSGVIPAGQVMIIENEGMPIQGTDKKGDLFVKFITHYPTELDDERKKFLRKILPKTDSLFKVKPPSDVSKITNKTMRKSGDDIGDDDYQEPPRVQFMRGGMPPGMRGDQGPECVTQ